MSYSAPRGHASSHPGSGSMNPRPNQHNMFRTSNLNRNTLSILFFGLLMAAAVACAGPDGSEGPEGPAVLVAPVAILTSVVLLPGAHRPRPRDPHRRRCRRARGATRVRGPCSLRGVFGRARRRSSRGTTRQFDTFVKAPTESDGFGANGNDRPATCNCPMVGVMTNVDCPIHGERVPA